MQLSAEQLAATAIDDNLVVNAGAGSGKTTVLTTRYIRLLEEGGLTPDQIVSITFTKKAAREMRERIDKKMVELAGTGAPQWKQARDQLVSAPIGTIHAFYARILRAFPVEAEIDPGFRVLEELETGILLNEARTITFQQALEEKCPHLALLTDILGAQALEEEGGLAAQLIFIYRMLLNRGIPVEDTVLSDMYDELPDWRQCQSRFTELVSSEADLAASLGDRDKPELVKVRRELVQAEQILSSIQDPRDLVELYQGLIPLTKLKGGKTKGHKEFVNGAVEQLCLLLSGGLAPVLGEATLSLLNRLDRVFRQVKARAGGLDFSDLQFAVWRLLQTHPQVISALRNRYRTYMIDEFQDTDRLQHKILVMLVEEEGDIPPGRLFVVGDEKQSIYRFRGAEVRVFAEVRRRLTENNPQREKKITCNYRSRQPLIDLVNALFSQLMAPSQGSEIQYVNLTAHRTGDGPGGELLDCAAETDDETPFEAEARTMAARIRGMVEEGFLVNDDEDKLRPVRYGDVAILVRSRTHLREYEHNLRLAGIPYTVVGGVGFYQQQEVVDLLNLLRVVGNLKDELSLAAVLRSPMFALNDDSLFALCQARRELGGVLLEHGAVLDTQQRQRLERAASTITRLRRDRGRLEIPHLLELALDLTQFREVTLTRFAGLQRYANLEKLMDLAGQYSAMGNNNLTGFLQWLEYAATQNEAEAHVDDEESDSVRIMTIHASKGLEFPVVFLPLCSSKLSVRPGSLLVDDDGKLAFKHAWQCRVWEQVLEKEQVREAEEFKRLLYVAITRARDWLVAMVREPSRKETSFNVWLQEFAGQSGGHFTIAAAQASLFNVSLPRPLPQGGADSSWDPQQVYTGLAPVGHGKRTFRYFSISQFLLWRQDQEQFNRRYQSRWVDSEPWHSREQRQMDWQHEPGGASFGTLLHSALEVVQPGTDIPTLLQDLVPRHFSPADKDQLDRVTRSATKLLAAYQEDPGPPGVFDSTTAELEFYYRLEDALFYGLIDRIMVADDHVAVLDYKTNKIPEQGIQPLLEAYSPQLRFYALAASLIYQRPARAYLQLLRLPPGQQTVEVGLSPGEQRQLLDELGQFVNYCVSPK